LTFKILAAISLFVSIPTGTPAAEPVAGRTEAVSAFIHEMAKKHGFDQAELERAFSRAEFQDKILELMERSAEPKPWEEYRATFINRAKIDRGERFWSQNRNALALARERYGVPEEIVAAVLGIETNYGRNTGRFKVLEALSTLAFGYPRRARLFRTELEHYLLLSREESLPLTTSRGSYAGAMGIAQFMPGSYRRYAIDFDGDGKRDLFSNAADAIGSVANYLTAHGWQRGAPVAAPALVAKGATQPFETSKLSTRYRLADLRELGITLDGAHPLDLKAIPLTLQNRKGPEYWLGFENFYVITRYNQSIYYAMAVHQLSVALREARDRGADEAP
jgi:membrane-bound lytic murein transglycosylase B